LDKYQTIGTSDKPEPVDIFNDNAAYEPKIPKPIFPRGWGSNQGFRKWEKPIWKTCNHLSINLFLIALFQYSFSIKNINAGIIFHL